MHTSGILGFQVSNKPAFCTQVKMYSFYFLTNAGFSLSENVLNIFVHSIFTALPLDFGPGIPFSTAFHVKHARSISIHISHSSLLEKGIK